MAASRSRADAGRNCEWNIYRVTWLEGATPTARHLQHEYQGYMAKKAQKRHSLIVSLTDENHRQLAEIERQRGEVEREFEERKAGRAAGCDLPCPALCGETAACISLSAQS